MSISMKCQLFVFVSESSLGSALFRLIHQFPPLGCVNFVLLGDGQYSEVVRNRSKVFDH